MNSQVLSPTQLNSLPVGSYKLSFLEIRAHGGGAMKKLLYLFSILLVACTDGLPPANNRTVVRVDCRDGSSVYIYLEDCASSSICIEHGGVQDSSACNTR